MRLPLETFNVCGTTFKGGRPRDNFPVLKNNHRYEEGIKMLLETGPGDLDIAHYTVNIMFKIALRENQGNN